jgi:dCMP deaminase
MRTDKNQYFLKLAKIVATRATCPRRSVGCVIINNYGHIKATGYNGVPSGFPHCTDQPCGGQDSGTGNNLEACMATHAEANALLQCESIMDIDKIYLTVSPCINCAKLIGNTSCKMVIYSEEYIDKDGINMLKKLGIITKYERIINREESQ